MELSGYPDGTVPELPEPAPDPKKPAVAKPMDDWTLVRAKDGRAGWVLSRMLLMAVPDEVAQYAERARITSYFTIGDVNDHGTLKPAYLWTVLAQKNAAHHFDGMRIFLWNVRRHRYETSFVERSLRGYLPLMLEGQGGTATGFKVIVEEKDGTVMEREYSLLGLRAKLVGRKPAERPDPWYLPPGATPKHPQQPPGWQGKAEGLLQGLKDKLKR